MISGEPAGNPDPDSPGSLDADIVAYYPADFQGDEGAGQAPYQYFSRRCNTRYARGSAIQMAAGYEGLGKGAAAGGGSHYF